MFNNRGNMGLPFALLTFDQSEINAAVAIFSLNNILQFSIETRLTGSITQTSDLLKSPVMIG